MPRVSSMDRLNVTEWDTMIDVNIKGVLNGIAAVLPYMKAAEVRSDYQYRFGGGS